MLRLVGEEPDRGRCDHHVASPRRPATLVHEVDERLAHIGSDADPGLAPGKPQEVRRADVGAPLLPDDRPLLRRPAAHLHPRALRLVDERAHRPAQARLDPAARGLSADGGEISVGDERGLEIRVSQQEEILGSVPFLGERRPVLRGHHVECELSRHLAGPLEQGVAGGVPGRTRLSDLGPKRSRTGRERAEITPERADALVPAHHGAGCRPDLDRVSIELDLPFVEPGEPGDVSGRCVLAPALQSCAARRFPRRRRPARGSSSSNSLRAPGRPTAASTRLSLTERYPG